MRTVLALVCALLFAGFGEAQARSGQAADLIDGTGVTAIVTDLGEGRYSVRYLFDEPQTALFFSRSGTDYRTASWQALDAGVTIERLQGFDALLFDRPRREARFEVTSRPDLSYDGYSHFIAFSDGAQALFTGQFELLPMETRSDILALEGQMSRFAGVQPTLGVRVVSDRRMVMHGERVEGDATEVSRGSGSFVYIGDGQIEYETSYVGILDNGLPQWIRDSFPGDLDFIFGELEAGWGFALPDRATLFFAFEGHERPGFSNKGGVAGNQLMIQSSGQALREENAYIRAYLLWFFAHEGVHLFQNVAPVALRDNSESWLHEGAANAMANGLLARQGEMTEAYLRNSVGRAHTLCLATLNDGALRGAGARNQFEAYYACGEFIALMSAAALPEHDLFDIWNHMQARAAERDGYYGAELYFETLGELGMAPDAIAQLRRLALEPVEDPRHTLDALLVDFGLDPQFDERDQLVFINYLND